LTTEGREWCWGNTIRPPYLDPSEAPRCDSSPCPVDCAVTPWMPWGRCEGACDGGNGTRTRIRNVIRPASDGGAACPALTETEACNPEACTGG
jgi:hypothetical protein